MGKRKAAKPEQLVPAADTEELPKRKRAKKQAAPAVPESLAGPTQRKASKQQIKSKSAGSKAEKKAGGKAKKQQEPKPKKKRAQKKQQEQEAGEDEIEEQQQEQEEPGKSVHDTFMEEVHAKEEELQKHCLIMDQVETDEDETTLEQLRALTRVFVPQQVQEDFRELWVELDEVGEDSEEEEEGEEGNDEQDDQPDILGAIMKAILGGKMLNTKHSSRMHTIFKQHQDKIDKAIKSKSWQDAFCLWAATLMASHREKHWYEDTDMPKDAEAVYSKMRQQWLKLKARSDEELGGLVAEGAKTPKEEFDTYLQAVADDMKTMDYKVKDVLA